MEQYIITDMGDDIDMLQQVAELLNRAFPEADGYPTMEAAREEAKELLEPGRVARVCMEGSSVLGIIGALPAYRGKCWELHPLVVREGKRGRGIGARLVADLEDQVRQRGGGTLYLGTDDVRGQTTLANRNLFPGVLAQLAQIGNINGHPYQFYLRQGYEIVGIIPDANGPGKPDIWMAKSV